MIPSLTANNTQRKMFIQGRACETGTEEIDPGQHVPVFLVTNEWMTVACVFCLFGFGVIGILLVQQ